jgi:hypothetical protein
MAVILPAAAGSNKLKLLDQVREVMRLIESRRARFATANPSCGGRSRPTHNGALGAERICR